MRSCTTRSQARNDCVHKRDAHVLSALVSCNKTKRAQNSVYRQRQQPLIRMQQTVLAMQTPDTKEQEEGEMMLRVES